MPCHSCPVLPILANVELVLRGYGQAPAYPGLLKGPSLHSGNCAFHLKKPKASIHVGMWLSFEAAIFCLGKQGDPSGNIGCSLS